MVSQSEGSSMPPHPPWLRFQAYLVGLPKTGSTSVAAMFGNYRSAHEWNLMDLVGPALARDRGELDDERFWQAVGPRLRTPSLEMDSCTSHHLYADVLAERFPMARFVLTVRDVSGWVTSLLDMILRKRIARETVDLPYSVWERDYVDRVTERTYPLDTPVEGDDRASLAPLMRYWAGHLSTMSHQLPAERSIVIRTPDLATRSSDLAALVGIAPDTLRLDLVHANRTPGRLDRLETYWDAELREAYVAACTGPMVSFFPDEHQRLLALPAPSLTEAQRAQRWAAHVSATRTWVLEAIATHGPQAATQ